MAVLNLGSWAPVTALGPLDGCALGAGAGGRSGVGGGPLDPAPPCPPWPPIPHLLDSLVLVPESLVLLHQNSVLHFLRDVRHKPSSYELDAQGHVLKQDEEGQPDGQQDPELLGEVVVVSIAVVPVPGVGKDQGQGSGVQMAPMGEGGSKPALSDVL